MEVRAEKKEKHILISSLEQGLSTFLSRISGLTRDIITANYLGASLTSDAFFIAFKIPNSIRKIIGEGPLSITFVPLFIAQYNKDKKLSMEFAGKIVLFLITITTFLTILAEIYMPSIVSIIAPGLKCNNETREMIIMLARISMPFMILTCTVAVLGGITNGMNIFFPFGITPFILNSSMIICLITLSRITPLDEVTSLTVGIIVGGILQVIFMLIVCKHYQCSPFFSLRTNNSNKKTIKKFFKNLTPIIFGQGIFQINMFVDGIFASLNEKVPSYLYYSDRLSQFAITIVGHTLGIVALPRIVKMVKQGKRKEGLKIQSECLFWCIVWAIPATTSLMVISDSLIKLIYQRGDFHAIDTYYVANMLKITCISMPFITMNRIYYSSLYALEKIRIPVVIGSIGIIINFSLNMILINIVDFYYVVISTTISNIIEWIILTIYLKKVAKFLEIKKREIKTLFKCIIANMMVLPLTYIINLKLKNQLFISISLNVTLSVLCYVSLLLLFKTFTIPSLKKRTNIL